MKKTILLIMMMIVSYAINAQPEKQGEVAIYADPRIDSLVQLHIAYNEAFPVMPGYRIQIFMHAV